MEKRVCPECKTENEVEYIYCKNCGVRLAHKQTQAENSKEKSAEANTRTVDNFAGRRNDAGYTPDNFIIDFIDGNPAEDVAAFVGKKAVVYLPKFSKMELSGSKVCWSWPAAVLGFLFGPLGAAIWFFYRKMYKIALILVAVGAILLSGLSLLGLNPSADALLEEQPALDTYGTVTEFEDIFGEALENITPSYFLSSAISDIISVATMVIAGIFGVFAYKRFISEKIARYRNSNIDPRYYKLGLAAVGGTSGGMAALGVVIMLVLQTIIDSIPALI